MVMESLRQSLNYRRMTEMTELTAPDDETPAAQPADSQTTLPLKNVAPVAGEPDHGGTIARRGPRRLTELPRETVGEVRCAEPFVIAEKVNVYYGDNHAIQVTII